MPQGDPGSTEASCMWAKAWSLGGHKGWGQNSGREMRGNSLVLPIAEMISYHPPQALTDPLPCLEMP